jgi:DNA-binding transcriptional LysR family regulator
MPPLPALPSHRPSAARALEWSDLELILAICRSESLSGAARLLGQTHSTIFRRINAVEAKTGVRFFDRFRHGYVMTDAGRTAMQYGERIESEFHSLGLEVLGQDSALRGRIRVTCPEAFAEEHAPAIVARFCDRHPEIRIDLAPSNFMSFSCTHCHEHSMREMDDEHDDVPGYVWQTQACYMCHPDGKE